MAAGDGGVEAGFAGVLLICGVAATTGRARSNSGDSFTGPSIVMPKSSHSKSESESQNLPVGCLKVAAAASISVTGNIHRGSRGGGCDPSFPVMERNLERIEGAKETGIHPVAGGETASGSETPRLPVGRNISLSLPASSSFLCSKICKL
jgi:hypothetical protein